MIRLAKLPDRTPVKMTIAIMPDLIQKLSTYARLYRDAYGSDEPVAELVPAILQAFLNADRDFTRALRKEVG